MAAAVESVQCFGRKKIVVAVCHCKQRRGLIKINGCLIELVEPEILRYKAFEPVLLLGWNRFAGIDMHIWKFVDEHSKKEIGDILIRWKLAEHNDLASAHSECINYKICSRRDHSKSCWNEKGDRRY
ncbi:hypothetical protein GOP47_0017349 [Adiantum capillus-veneris]|uniref:40S ribosomal protein S16 n=1 Tax=Adiantum capillus-veneris TaxID=13818 RepID=A0A9D4ZBN7_ADICA|nr:hypothetical protein GOP47_0017349 [Adiantum capillus-veneris]